MQFVLNNWYLFLALAVIVALLIAPSITQRLYNIQSLSPAQAVLLVNRESGVFVDVSEPSEYKNGHIPNAINAPLATLAQGVPLLEKYKQKPVVVAGRVPSRALKAATELRKRGFTAVHVLAGGLAAWEKESLPLEK